MTARLARLFAATLLLVVTPTSASMQAVPASSAVRNVRVALDPAQRRALALSSRPTPFASLAHGYSELVGQRTGMRFKASAASSSVSALQAVCEHGADLMLLLGELENAPCPLSVSPPYYRGETLVAVRHAGAAQIGLDVTPPHRVAVVQGSRYPQWLQAHYPQVQVITATDLSGALWAVETGVTDAALGLDILIRPLVRREHADSLLLRSAPDGMPGNVRLVARAADQHMLDDIDAAMQAITPQQHAQVLQRLAQRTYVDAPSLAALFRHFRWELMATGMGLSLMLATGAWLVRAHQSAQRHERNQARVIGVMSHEVRNAAQALVASVDLLSQSGLDKGQRQLVDAACAAGVGLRQLLDHALDYSRTATGQFGPCMGWHDINPLAHDCVNAIRPAAEAKGLRITLLLTPDPLPQLRTDATALRQILNNLLGNALKFTAQGAIEVRFRLLRRPAGNRLQVAVSDTGVGIPVERQSSVFKPFAQAHDDHSREMGGVGLGLSICRTLVHALQGNIELHSQPGQGSRFEVTLPVSCLSTNATVAGQPLAGHSLLLVEDHAPSRTIVARQLAALGAAVRTCSDGASALRLQAAHPSTLLMIDCDLVDMSGYQLAAALRGLERAHARPAALLVAFSGTDSLAHVQRCRASGMDAVLGKPLDPAQLLAVVGVATDEGATSAAAMTAHDPSWAPFLHSLQQEVQAVRQARKDGELRLVRYHAHRAAGVLRMLGHEGLAGTAADLHELSLANTLDWDEMDPLLDHLQQAVAMLTEACAI